MKIKVLQADTRDIILQLQSRNLYYGSASDYSYESLMKNNEGELFHPEDAQRTLSLCCLVTMMKCKLLGIAYEFVKGNAEDWNFPKIHNNANVYDSSLDSTKRNVTWLKPRVLLEQMSSEENKSVDIFCILDTDAWIRDDRRFQEFLDTFSKSPAIIAMAEDVERSTLLNSGFIAIKNNVKGRQIIDKIYNDPKYSRYYTVVYHEQSALCDYYLENKDEFMILPLNDFNTPCGSVVRHAWLHGLYYKLVVDEILGVFTKLCLGCLDGSVYKIGGNVLVYDLSAECGKIPQIKKY
uniref:Nucleotide-diphospho-sugar transferase domain-containing protein n=1 Tax=viral metagenome TaxID=1070528 RepID=A0A6C0KP96_9ZZZZ